MLRSRGPQELILRECWVLETCVYLSFGFFVVDSYAKYSRLGKLRIYLAFVLTTKDPHGSGQTRHPRKSRSPGVPETTT